MQPKIKKWFHNSETIFLARMQVIFGFLSAVIMWVVNNPSINTAFQELLTPKLIPIYIIALGILTEVLRRRRATDL